MSRADLTAGSPLSRFLDRLAGAIEHAEGLDAVIAPVAAAEQKVLGAPWLKNLLSGTPIGHPLHPLLVTLPIGAWSAALVFDLVGDERGAQRLVGMGVLTAFPAAAAGASDWSDTSAAEQRVGFVHAIANSLSIGAYTLSWWERRRGNRARGIAWSLAGATAVSAGGWLGGHLSYALGVGVDTTAFQHVAQDWTPTVAADTVRAGKLTAADANGVPLVLTRDSHGAVVALADRCTHRGGPLHEGEVVDGCVVCPLHGSRFALDGTVLRGPATRPQLAYAVSEQDGLVMVRVADEQRGLRTDPVGV